MKNENDKIKTSILLGLLIATALSMFIVTLYVDNDPKQEKLEVKESLMTKQVALEKNIKKTGFTLDNPNVILDPYDISPLTALVIFETEEEGVPKITVEGKDDLSTIKGEGNAGTTHRIPIYGLYANKENKVTIEFNGKIKEVYIHTEELDERVKKAESTKVGDASSLSNDFYFTTPSSNGLPTAYDVNGDVRWYLTEELTWEISQLDNGKLLLGTERLINPPYYNTGLYEIDFLGKVYNEYSLPGGYHHDYYELENGNLLIASDDFTDFAFGTVEDLVVEVDRDNGEVIKKWNLKDVLPQDQGKSENWVEFDWFHNNSVWYDEEHGEIILSGRHQDAVVALDYETGALQWILGDPTGWEEEMQEYFFTPIGDDFEWQWSQHSAKVTPEGNIILLDNGNNKSKLKEEYVPAENSYTRGVEYSINRENMTIEQEWQYGKERGSDFYSPYISDVDYLGPGHSLVHSGGTAYLDGKVVNKPAGLVDADELVSTTVEVLNNDAIFELSLPTNNYRAEKMNMYAINESVEFGKPGRLGTLGETKVDRVHDELGDFERTDDYYNTLNVSFTQEEDRLVMNGMFKKQGFYELVLVGENSIRGYDFVASSRPYTALCVDVFSEKRTDGAIEVNKYINSEGLQGEHEVYLRASDKLYDTNVTVDFGE